MGKSAVLIVDMLKGFFKGDPILSPLDPGRLIEMCRRLVHCAREAEIPIIFLKDNFWPEEIKVDLHFTS